MSTRETKFATLQPRAERSQSPEEKELATDKFIEDGQMSSKISFSQGKKRLRPVEETVFKNMIIPIPDKKSEARKRRRVRCDVTLRNFSMD